LAGIAAVYNFTEKEGMVKDHSIRQQMFASITSWQSGELSQKKWCNQQGITYHFSLLVPKISGRACRAGQ
jgi:hypothetical protein